MKKILHLLTGTSVLLLAAFLVYWFWLASITIIGGFILYLIMVQQVEFFERRGFSERQSYLLLGLAGNIILVSGILFVSIPLFEQFKSFVTQAPELITELSHSVQSYQEQFPFIQNLFSYLRTSVINIGERLFGLSGSIITAVVTIPIITGILLTSRHTLRATFANSIPNEYFEVVMTIINDISTHVQDYVWARTVETIALIIIHAIGFIFIGLPNALFLAVFAGVLNLIPYVGPLFAVIPIAVAAWVSNGVSGVIWALAILAIAQVIDNTVLQTRVIAKLVEVHPLLVVIVTIIGQEVLGPIGLIIAIPAYVILKIIIKGFIAYIQTIERHEQLRAKEYRRE